MVASLFQHFSTILTVGLLTVILHLVLLPIARQLSFVDKPNARKSHNGDVPVVGGLCIFLALTLSIFIFGIPLDAVGLPLLGCSSLFMLLGFLDDQFDLKAITKLFAQTIICSLFITFSGVEILELGSLLGLELAFESGFFSFLFTLIAIVGLTNAFNLIDGCDGQSASLGVLAVLAMLYFSFHRFETPKGMFLLLLLVSLSVFLFFNFSSVSKFKTFLGDAGSLLIGFIVSVSLVDFANGSPAFSPTIVLWFVAVPVFDFCAVVVRRITLRRKIMSADRSHIHHYLFSFGLSHFQTTTIVLLAAILLLLLGVYLESNYPALSSITFFGLFTIYLAIRIINRR